MARPRPQKQRGVSMRSMGWFPRSPLTYRRSSRGSESVPDGQWSVTVLRSFVKLARAVALLFQVFGFARYTRFFRCGDQIPGAQSQPRWYISTLTLAPGGFVRCSFQACLTTYTSLNLQYMVGPQRSNPSDGQDTAREIGRAQELMGSTLPSILCPILFCFLSPTLHGWATTRTADYNRHAVEQNDDPDYRCRAQTRAYGYTMLGTTTWTRCFAI